MTAPRVSVVVVSRERPDSLTRCLLSLTRQTCERYEIIVVADKAGRRQVDTRPELFGRVRVVPFDRPNISEARNLGIIQAGGEIVAFIDDDAVAEPLWLERLAEAFSDSRVIAATGYVIGRNGISYQHKIRDVGPNADSNPIPIEGHGVRVIRASVGRAIKTEGTNMAFRREALLMVHGFDPAYRFYLDETDLDLRLAGVTAVVPRAVVHHGVAPSERRRADRVPRSLYDVGLSLALFLRRHSDQPDISSIGRRERDSRRRGLLAHMVDGRIEPRDVGRVLRSFDEGWAEGCDRELRPLEPLDVDPEAPRDFLAYRPDPPVGEHRIVAGRIWQEARKRAEALRMAEEGNTVTLFLFSPTSRFHRAWFDLQGYWIQRGGLFGKSVRRGKLVQFWRFGGRVRAELNRLVGVRGDVTGNVDNRR